MASSFEDFFTPATLPWQVRMLQEFVDWGQQVAYSGVANLLEDFWDLMKVTGTTAANQREWWKLVQNAAKATGRNNDITTMMWMLENALGEHGPRLRAQLEAELLKIIEGAGRFISAKLRSRATRFPPATLTTELSFDLINPATVAWAKRHSGALVTNVTNQMRGMVGHLATRAMGGEFTTTEFARAVYDFIPLLPNHAQAVMNARARDIEYGIHPDVADARARRYAERLRRYRSTNIARTEVLSAQNAGLQALFSTKAESGSLPSSVQKIWVATRDDLTCPRCRPMHGKMVVPDGTWSGPGPRNGEYVTVSHPPLHPSCRCTMALVVPTLLSRGEMERITLPIP